MTDLIITADDIDADGVYTPSTSLEVQGNLIVEEELGVVRVVGSIVVSGYIYAKAGSGIKAGDSIEAGLGIEATTLSARLRIFAGLCSWRIPRPDETEVRAKILSGTLILGVHVPPAAETFVPEASE